MLAIAPLYTQRTYAWTAWKAMYVKKSFTYQYEEYADSYLIWGYDGPEAHLCTIWKGIVPLHIVNGDAAYSQVQNDLDKTDWETTYKTLGNAALVPSVSGVALSRGTVTRTGWHFEPRAVKFKTATYGSLNNKKADGFSVSGGTSYTDAVLRFFKSDGTELTKNVGELDAAFQIRLDLNCTCTILDWQPAYDMDIRSGKVSIINIISNEAYVHVVAAPDLPAIYGGNVPFNSGGLDLRHMPAKTLMTFDANGAKFVAYDPVYNTNKFRIKLLHILADNFDFQVIFEHYKA